MSTKLTIQRTPQNPAIPLTVLLEAASNSVLRSLASWLRENGFEKISESHLILFGNLDCGSTHASQIAHRMGVSRQAISKTLSELQAHGYLHLRDDPHRKNQKVVEMTESGQRLAVSARGRLSEIETAISRQVGDDAMATFRSALEQIWSRTTPG